MSEPTSHVETFIRDNMPPPEQWPEMDYSALPGTRRLSGAF